MIKWLSSGHEQRGWCYDAPPSWHRTHSSVSTCLFQPSRIQSLEDEIRVARLYNITEAFTAVVLSQCF